MHLDANVFRCTRAAVHLNADASECTGKCTMRSFISGQNGAKMGSEQVKLCIIEPCHVFVSILAQKCGCWQFLRVDLGSEGSSTCASKRGCIKASVHLDADAFKCMKFSVHLDANAF